MRTEGLGITNRRRITKAYQYLVLLHLIVTFLNLKLVANSNTMA
jgi:hypothetical protein